MNNPLGLYIHVPFCRGKCPYCDFYSLLPDREKIEEYTQKICSLLEKAGGIYNTVYFGGGTPSVLGGDRIAQILSFVSHISDCEITVECNPYDCASGGFDFNKIAKAGVNRVSLGLQSADDCERRALGRRSSARDVGAAVNYAKESGITNISLDLMLGIPHQTIQSLMESIDFCFESGATHISAYMLKIEPGTRFFEARDKLQLPDEDTVCDMYLAMCDQLSELGYKQYEISNFAKDDFESRHNLKYWHCEEYLGIGPSAHSFVDGKRFYYSRSLEDFLNGAEPVADGEGGSFEEYAMLALRLNEGLIFERVSERFGFYPESVIKKAQAPRLEGLVNVTNKNISLTTEGFLLSNSVIAELIL